MYHRIKDYKRYLVRLRLKWFIGIWLGYAAVILYALCPHGFADIYDFAENLTIAVILGLVCWFVNVIVWSHCVTSLNKKAEYLEELENKYNEIVQK